MDFSGKRVLITGGSRGIGRACAKGFAERGAAVAINYLSNRSAAETTLAELTGGGHTIVQADVSDPEAAKRLVAAAAEALGIPLYQHIGGVGARVLPRYFSPLLDRLMLNADAIIRLDAELPDVDAASEESASDR